MCLYIYIYILLKIFQVSSTWLVENSCSLGFLNWTLYLFALFLVFLSLYSRDTNSTLLWLFSANGRNKYIHKKAVVEGVTTLVLFWDKINISCSDVFCFEVSWALLILYGVLCCGLCRFCQNRSRIIQWICQSFTHFLYQMKWVLLTLPLGK